jgi:hypothetical protein
MVDKTDIVNMALQTIGTRTTVTAAELANETSNEAIQANLVYERYRDELLRMAPWDCALKTADLVYITSLPGTAENTSPATSQWQYGQPSPPWSYEYQYPADCLKACWILPGSNSGWSGGVPITTAVTGRPSTWYKGPPVKFKVHTDNFYYVTGVSVVSGGSGYAVGDVLQVGGLSPSQVPDGNPPIGAPVLVRVTGVGASGAVQTVEILNQVHGANPVVGGSYFAPQTGNQPAVVQWRYRLPSTTGSSASFSLTWASAPSPQRVILTNQSKAVLAYIQRVENPNVMDDLFLRAWINLLGAGLCMALTGDKSLANGRIQLANEAILEARKADGNEGLTVNDVTPDWLRARGLTYPDVNIGLTGPDTAYDWGGLWASW